MDIGDHPLTWLGTLAALFALLAWCGDWRRRRRKKLDAVGWMPWTNLFFGAAFVAVVLLVLGAREWL
jgi:prolipoprotein diacylglyceryltransferase